LRGVSRLHLILGIFGYLAGPLWLAFLLTFNWIYWYQKYTGLSDITVQAFTPYLNLSGTAHALLIFIICMVVIMLPKFLALIDLARLAARRAFGGLRAPRRRRRRNHFFHAARAVADALAHALRRHQPFLGISVGWARKNAPPTARLAVCLPTALGAHA
jgi:membrane glycosyltransferase